MCALALMAQLAMANSDATLSDATLLPEENKAAEEIKSREQVKFPQGDGSLDDATSEEEVKNLVLERLKEERLLQQSSFAITPHHTNYVLPLTHTTRPNEQPYADTDVELQHTEMEFQVSFKVAVNEKPLLNDNGYLYFSYTAKSFWQAYNTNESSPFRDTNHEPEVFVTFTTDAQALGASIPVVSFGFSHQSNGRSDEQSRSWNRVFARVAFEYEKYYWSFKPWWRLPESGKDGPDDPKGDDNPDIDDYLGYFELRGFRRYGANELSLMVRNNLRSENRGAIELGYSYPFAKTKRGYVQLFHGYGESLLDYNHRTTRLGIGIMLNNWL